MAQKTHEETGARSKPKTKFTSKYLLDKGVSDNKLVTKSMFIAQEEDSSSPLHQFPHNRSVDQQTTELRPTQTEKSPSKASKSDLNPKIHKSRSTSSNNDNSVGNLDIE